jgi:hypothetical protein
MAVYLSCNCRHCRAVPSKVKGHHKRMAHRALRRASREAIQKDREQPSAVSTGYKA